MLLRQVYVNLGFRYEAQLVCYFSNLTKESKMILLL